jgi:cobalt-zinc-cadmium efflux system membrane fusion protein
MVSQFVRTWRVTWMTLSSIATLAVVVMLLWPPPERQVSAKPAAANVSEAFTLSPEGDILIPAGSPLEAKVEIVEVQPEEVSFPLLRVTGSIVARLLDVSMMENKSKAAEDRWQFSNEDLSSTYAEWLKTQTEIDNAKKQLAKVEELTRTTVEFKTKVVTRTEKLVASGTEAPRELVSAKADLEQFRLQGQKDVYTAQSALKLAEKNLDSLERRFQQAGIDPEVFDNPEEDTTLIVANVPEQKMAIVHEGQGCTASLYGYPGRFFSGHVEKIGATVSQERRTMRVLFHITDSEDLLKPGMFAEIGLGTDKRPALLVPAEAMLHVGSTDYLLVEAERGRWKITPCVAGESHGTKVEITQGLEAGQRIIARGAILLKPLVVQAKIK